LEQTLGHAVAVPHAPLSVQVWMLLPSLHIVAPGAQTPVQTLPEQAWPVQIVGAPQVPDIEQVRTRVASTHSVTPGVHSPAHSPWMQA
jgi:hypothetical protein